MDKLTIFLSDGNWDGPVTMDSPSSMFKVIRVKKVDLNIYQTDLNLPGIYFLLIGTDTVYVGQTSDSIYKRILNTHSGEIDKLWHTVVGFPFKHNIISSNTLLYMENAMCEFAHSNYAHCLTTTPAKSNCNLKYRNANYSLSGSDILTCMQYIDDIKYYISSFKDASLFSGTAIITPSPTLVPAEKTVTSKKSVDSEVSLNLTSEKKGAIATGLLLDGNRLLVKKGSKVAKESRMQFQKGLAGMEALRQELMDTGVIQDFIFTTDYEFSSPSGAAAVILGTSANGKAVWKTADGCTLGELLKK